MKGMFSREISHNSQVHSQQSIKQEVLSQSFGGTVEDGREDTVEETGDRLQFTATRKEQKVIFFSKLMLANEFPNFKHYQLSMVDMGFSVMLRVTVNSEDDLYNIYLYIITQGCSFTYYSCILFAVEMLTRWASEDEREVG